MPELNDELEQVRKTGDRAAFAVLVGTRGTSPRKEGAHMWVGEGGGILGAVTIGGCVDAEVVRASEAVLRTSSQRLLSVDLGDEDAHALGLTCAGTLDVLVRATNLAGDDALVHAYERARGHTRAGGRAVVAIPLPAAGPEAPRSDQVLVVFEDGTTWGSLGSEAVDREAVALAAERLTRGGSRTHTLAAGPLDVFFEVHGRGPLLVIVGGGAIATPLAAMSRTLGLYVVIVEGRDRFADAARFPEAHEVRAGMPSEIVGGLEFDATSAIVLVAHDYKYDLPALKAALNTDAGYIGMLGSRRRADSVLQMLREDGVGEAALARIRTPIGLDLGGQSAAEIALSILAEVVAVRNGRTGGSLKDRASNSGAAGRTAPPAV
jgi:xanthine dehydrogenase accessory factor